MRRPPAPALLVVVPAGAFDASRREFEERIAGLPASITGRMQVAEDTEGGWARTFDVEATPTLFLINARREFVWSAAGELDPAEIAAALDRHVVPAPAPRFRSLRPRVSVGNRAPDVVFRDDRGEEGAIHRFRGRPILLTFWQAWSEPSLAELRRLEALLRNDGERDAPFILAFHGGPAREDFDEIRKAHGITFPIVQDTGHRGARAFGVRCWPTTIAIDPDGRVEHIRLGMGSDLAPSPGTEEPLQAAT